MERGSHTLLPRPERRRWWGKGPSRVQSRVLNGLLALTSLLIFGGVLVRLRAGPEIAAAAAAADEAGVEPGPRVLRRLDSALTDRRAPTTAYIDDAALRWLEPLRGESGKLRAVLREPGEVLGTPEDPHLQPLYEPGSGEPAPGPGLGAPEDPGVYGLHFRLGQATRQIRDLSVITLVPFSAKKNDRVGLYYIGRWPYEKGGKPKTPAYANPRGFIEVTRENRDTLVSEHFRIGDFLTKDQRDVWPKYVVIEPKLVDKLELVIQDLEARGIDVRHMQVMSGFRTPRYNVSGGNTEGRASLSRHMYGDAADVFVDNDRDSMMDDINGDGKVDTRDAEVIAEAAERVARRHPSLTGGIGIYKACCGHGPFTHVDTRGYRARWRY